MVGGEEIGEAEGERAERLVHVFYIETVPFPLEWKVSFQTRFSGLFLRNWFLQNSCGGPKT
jgi:hypothetical protein